jgi:hypothetical protein
MTAPSNARYWAFISYSSKDRKWGEWLRRRLENYKIPNDLQGHMFADGTVLGKYLRPIFRDRDELPGSDSLSEKIEAALEASRYLVVLCSPSAAKSKWVDKEIADFQSMGKSKNIRALILRGEPNSGNPETECLPPSLRLPLDPIAGDLRKEGDGKERGFLKILAGIAELDFDTVYRRHERAAKRVRAVWLTISSILIFIFAALAVVAWNQSRIAAQQRDEARRQKSIAEQETLRAEQNLERSQRESYASGIRASAGLIEKGSYDAAREILIDLPKPYRKWEWGYLMEICGPPSWKIESGSSSLYHPVTSISEALAPIVADLQKASREEFEADTIGLATVERSDLIAIYDRASTRHGAYLCVLSKNTDTDYSALDPESLAHSNDARLRFFIWSGNYGSIEAAKMSDDGSLLLVKASGHSTYSPSITFDVSKEVSHGPSSGNSVYVIPLPSKPNVETVIDPDSPGISRTYWQYYRLSKLPAETIQTISQLEHFDESSETTERRFADFYPKKDGSIAVLFNVWNKEWSGEIIELPSQKLVTKVGRKVAGGEPFDLTMTDQGGTFSPDGKLVLLCPSGMSGNPPSPAEYWERPNDTAAIFDVASGKHISTLGLGGRYEFGRSADPVWGFSPNSEYVFQSSDDAALEENIITVCKVSDGNGVEVIPRYLRFIAWSPNSSFIYYVQGDGSTIEIADSVNFRKVGEIPNALQASSSSAFTELETASSPDGSRVVIGSLLFGEGPTTPLLRLPKGLVKSPLRSWLLDNLKGNLAPNLSLRDKALVYWVSQCDGR